MSEPILHVEDLHVSVEGKAILKGLDLKIAPGEIHAIMGKPGYQITRGRIVFKGQDLAGLAPEARARLGVFLAFQYPTEVPGVSVVNFLRTAYNSVNPEATLGPLEFRKFLQTKLDLLEVSDELINRYVNAGFSGGERKRAEVLQMAVLDPQLAILDETDTGLDIDALREVSEGVKRVHNEERGMLVITHYQRLLNYIEPGFVHVLLGGRFVRSGGKDVALDLEAKGYEQFRAELGISEDEELTDEA
ncbi:MAG TPA: Fe-S cluster assembly ATPase SufC [Actinomycetota bacterium]|nr:Fe-S cluster assembly ATPase SufC [Actinomycetota bacterium]